jgi:hypothetical protein
MATNAWGGGIRLRPLEIGDVLDETFRVYKRQFVPLITVMGLVVIPTSLVTLPLVLLGAVNEATLERFFRDGLNLGLMIGGVAAIVVVAIISSLAQLLAAGAAVRVASGGILGQPVSVGDAYREAFGHFDSLLLASFVVFVPVSLLVITCIGIPFAIFVGLGWSLVFQAILLEGHGAIDAMRRSWELVGGHRWRLLACLVLIGVIVWLLVSIPTGLFSFLSAGLAAASGGSQTMMMVANVGNVVFQAAGQTLFGAIGLVTTTLLYYDLRIRKEAFDLQQRLPHGDSQQAWQAPQYSQQPPYSPQDPSYPQQPQQPPYAPEDPQQHPPRPPQIPPPPPQTPPPPPGR